ncbi:hypothetical protein RI129_011449 [Pyrocoelia pectoralis]|uniref:C2H2-type domain-containing protein n=1 Tax=Pyrocoelia pectoralis TaxID=417401 RepID=A0AAN7V7X9_9COLE
MSIEIGNRQDDSGNEESDVELEMVEPNVEEDLISFLSLHELVVNEGSAHDEFTTGIEEYLISHMNVCIGLKEFKETYSSVQRRDLSLHIRYCHKSRQFKLNKGSVCHLKKAKRDHGFKKFKCKHCPYLTGWKANIIRHLKVNHNSKRFETRSGNRVAGQEYNYEESILTSRIKGCLNRYSNNSITYNVNCKSKKFKCNHCYFSTSHNRLLALHVESQHSSLEYKCIKCNYTSMVKRYLMRHYNRCHNLNCEDCNVCCNSKQLKCAHCYFTTSYKTSLALHIESQHGSIEYKCVKCSYTTRVKNYLITHFNRCHDSKLLNCEASKKFKCTA